MKTIIVLCTLAAVALAAPAFITPPVLATPAPDKSYPVILVKETPLDNIGIDGYQFGYELSNGVARQESAKLVNVNSENPSLSVQGSFTYVDPSNNVRYTVNYVADETGFHPQGEHIPSV